MDTYLFATFIAFLINFVLIVPFINFLYRLKLQRVEQKTKDMFNKSTPIFDKFHGHKVGVPVGGGLLVIVTTVVLFAIFLFLFVLFNTKIQTNFPSMFNEVKIILFAFLGFSLLGVYDDLNKIFFWKKRQFFGLRFTHKLVIEVILAFIVAFWIYNDLKVDIGHVPFFGVFHIGVFYIIVAAFTIISFANAVNITDGLDGLATGILMISLASFWIIASSVLDVPTSLFIAIWLGGLMAFLYFNIYPARLFMGDTGALSFGATFATIGLILGKPFSLVIIGGIFLIEIISSLLQLLSKKFFKRKLFPVAPFHLFLQYKNWEEPKIVMRLWLISIMFSVFGLMLSFLK